MKQISHTILVCCSLFLLSGCSEYWWTRGQPPGVEQLVARSQQRLHDARQARSAAREDVAAASERVEKSLLTTLEIVAQDARDGRVLEQLQSATDGFLALEGKLSVGSRAAYGELAGQMRSFSQAASEGKGIGQSTFGLFTARTLFFLANELRVPPPSVG
ncbi:MAG: hypothetical protein KDD69_12845 [Bdellovibrionales bacterium]|nr:hypothetical protein [Bdellovibrionales bacterium]